MTKNVIHMRDTRIFHKDFMQQSFSKTPVKLIIPQEKTFPEGKSFSSQYILENLKFFLISIPNFYSLATILTIELFL